MNTGFVTKNAIMLTIAGLVLAAWSSPLPIAEWDGDFSSLAKNGCTITLNTGNVVALDGKSITIGSTSLGVTVAFPSNVVAGTVIAKYSSMTKPSSGNGLIVVFNNVRRNVANWTGVFLSASGDTLGLWNGTVYDKADRMGTWPLYEGSSVLCCRYAPKTTGLHMSYRRGDTVDVDVYSGSGHTAGNAPISTVTIGGPTEANASFAVLSGLSIESIAVFDEELSDAEMINYYFRSEIVDCSATLTDGGSYTWETLPWNTGGDIPMTPRWQATLILEGNATLTLDASETNRLDTVIVQGPGTLTFAGTGAISTVNGMEFTDGAIPSVSGDVLLDGPISLPENLVGSGILRLGKDFRGTLKTTTQRIVFGDTSPVTAGTIVIDDGWNMTVDRTNIWFGAGGMQINGNLMVETLSNLTWNATLQDVVVGGGGMLTFAITTSTPNNIRTSTAWDFSRVTGTGKLCFTTDGEYVMSPIDPAKFPADTLSFVNEALVTQTTGTWKGGYLLRPVGTEETPSLVSIGTLSGNGGFRTDAGGKPTATGRRVLRIVQAADSEWSGIFMGINEDLQYLEVKAAESAVSKTLTLSGEQFMTNELRVATGASVRLSGTWVGNIMVNGEFGGSGTNRDGMVTFASGANINADWGVWEAEMVVSLPPDLEVTASCRPKDDVPLFKTGNAASLALPRIKVTYPNAVRMVRPICVDGVVRIPGRRMFTISFK